MKQTLGVDLGVSSVGWAIVREDENENRKILDLGVRIVPEDPNFHGKFYEGNTASKNADRRTKRGIRRNNQRFKLRRNKLKEILQDNKMYPDDDLLYKKDKLKIHQLRAEAVEKSLTLEEIGRVLIHLNHNRGFLSNRKAITEEDNSTDYKKQLSENESALNGRTIGQYKYERLKQDPHFRTKDKVYLRKTYISEFDKIWEKQKEFYPTILTGGPKDDGRNTLYQKIKNETIFYQRPLKSQKHLISHCNFETFKRVAPKSSPLFQLFRIYQQVNSLRVTPYGVYQEKPLDNDQRKLLVSVLLSPEALSKKGTLSKSKILSLLGQKKGSLNFEELYGEQTKKLIFDNLKEMGIRDVSSFFNFDPQDTLDQGYMHLWHILYSLENMEDVVTALTRHFPLTREQALCLSSKVSFNSNFGSLSAKAIRKLLPHLQEGLLYNEACDAVGYDHSGYKTEVKKEDFIPLLKPNELRNPVVEQVLNQMVNVVNTLIKKHGPMDEVVVEMARDLKNNAKTRKTISANISKNKKVNDKLREKLKEEYDFSKVNGRDVKRYKLWEETDRICLYCLKKINTADLLNGNADIEHIIPRSRSFNDSLHNKIIAHAKCNRDKGQLTALDYMIQKGDHDILEGYHNEVQRLMDNKIISPVKYKNLLTPGSDVESGFLSRQMKDTQYIVVEAVKRLRTVCSSVRTTTGTITDLLREQWELNHTLQELTLPVYEKIGATETKSYKDSQNTIKEYEVPVDWSKRDDHRHHAIDALIVALTSQSVIFRLNNLNKLYQYKNGELSEEKKEQLLEKWKEMGLPVEKFDFKSFSLAQSLKFEAPIADLREKARDHLSSIFISFKKQSKAISPKINKIKTKKGVIQQKTLVPRGSLHNDTIHGKIKLPIRVKINSRFAQIDDVVDQEIKELLTQRIAKYGSSKKAFSAGALKKDPVLHHGRRMEEVDVFEHKFKKRVPINALTSAQIEKIIDQRTKKLIEQRVSELGSLKNALESFEAQPLYLDKDKKVRIKSVSIRDEGNLIAIHEEDHQPKDYVYTAGNHHVLIYKDEKGNYHDRVVPFWDAVAVSGQKYDETGRVTSAIQRADLPEKGWKFVYDLQKNDLVVIDLDLKQVDITDAINLPLISQHLYRVQKFSKEKGGSFRMDFRHHLESTIDRNHADLRGITWERFQANKYFQRLTKIQINNIGEIIALHMP